MLGKAVAKKPPAPPMPQNGVNVRSDAAAPVMPRKARGLHKEETRDELLRRLVDPTLTLEEAACILEVCSTTVRRYTNRGILPHERSAGNQRRFKLSSVLAFKEDQQRKAGEPAQDNTFQDDHSQEG